MGGVAALGTVLLAEADDYHLEQAALYLIAERGMRFDAVDYKYRVCLICVFVKLNAQPALGIAEGDGLHGGQHRYAHGLFGYAHAGKDATLSLSGSSAVAAHSRHNERFASMLLKNGYDFLEDEREIIYLAAAGSQRHAVSGLDTLEHSA